jgi:hypothetical protein
MQPKLEIKIVIQNAESTRTVEDIGSLAEKLANLWCTLMHDSPSWPIHGHYTYLTCGRQHLIRWERVEGPLTSPGALKNADLQAPAEHLTSAPAVFLTARRHLHEFRLIPRMEHRML